MATTATLSSTLVDVLRREIRARHMSLRTNDTCVYCGCMPRLIHSPQALH